MSDLKTIPDDVTSPGPGVTEEPDTIEASEREPTAPARSAVDATCVSDRFRSRIPRDFAREHLILSQGSHESKELLAVADTTHPTAIFNTGVALQCSIETVLCDSETIARAVDDAYGAHHQTDADSEKPHDDESQHIDELLAQADRDLLSTQGKGPVVKLVDALLFEALSRGASDVHIQPLADRTLVRYRLDGVLHSVRELPRSRVGQLTAAVTSRIKVMGNMDIAERRIPQDGRASVNIGKRAIDLRISTLPTSYGERAVIRLLDNTHQLSDFAQIGMPSEIADGYLDRARRTNGMILLTGPTGSGKTTTLYSTLRHIGSPELNIMTIEDPIEYELSSPEVGMTISQAQVNTRKGVTFATGLRHILRQDPDVVMVGEIRDAETARVAIQSSLTGHLVFSTLHTNDAASAVTRIIDLEIEPYLVSASLSAVMAQRLVRTFHSECAGNGCKSCFSTGFQGRTGLFELLTVDETIRELINHGAALADIRAAARKGGMRTLAEDGQRLVERGVTNEMEVKRVVQGAL